MMELQEERGFGKESPQPKNAAKPGKEGAAYV